MSGIVENTIQSREKQIKEELNNDLPMLRAKLAPAMEMIETMKVLFNGRIMAVLMQPSTFILDIKVEIMTEVTPFLELLENKLNMKFDRSKDEPDAGWRRFSSSEFKWLVVDANIYSNDDSKNCRRVIKGYKQVPEYEIVCDDQSSAPSASADGINSSIWGDQPE